MSETITEADVAMLRSAAAHGRETLRGIRMDFTAPRIPSPIGACLAGDAAAPAEAVATIHRCRCGTEVPGRLDSCPACVAEDQAYLRRRKLADAFDSVSPERAQDWCRAGTPDYLTAIVSALAVCGGFVGADREMALRIVQGHYKRADGSLMLLGPTGIGKTAIATACALRVLDLGVRGKLDKPTMAFAAGIRFASALELARVREDSKFGSKPPMMLEAEKATLLLLDEIGFERRGTDPTMVRDLIWDRARHGRPTIITSGKTRAQLENTSTGYGQPMIRRIEELGMVIDMHRGSR